MGWDCFVYKSYWLRDHFLLVPRSDHTTGSRNIKPEVVFKVQKMAPYASFCLIMGPFKGEVLFLPDYGPLALGLVFTRDSIYAIARICYGNSVCLSVRPSVRLSVCLSVTRVDQSKTFEARITQFPPYSSPVPLVFRG